MNTAIAIWLFFRAVRWLSWIGLLGYCFYLASHGETELNSYGHLPFGTEMLIFALGSGAVFAGFLELMMRERTGLPRPSFGQLIPPRQAPADAQAKQDGVFSR